jgi:hypothetical protein
MDEATSETELRQLWTSLGMSPDVMERAIKLKTREFEKRKPSRQPSIKR